MKIESVDIRGFRNLPDLRLDPDQHLTFLSGANGQGKTSILEALGHLATFRSFRGASAEEMIAWNLPQASITARASVSDVPGDARITLENRLLRDPLTGKTRRLALINGKAYTSGTQYLSQRFGQLELGFHAVVFNPADHELVRGAPGERRAFLDQALTAEETEYLRRLARYQKLLQQRNALLKRETPRVSRDELSGFTEPWVETGAWLTHQRLLWLSRAQETLKNTARRIAPNQPDLRLFYVSTWVPEIEGLSFQNKDLSEVHFSGQGTLPSLEILERAFWNRLSQLEEAERRSQTSLVGPHRDDWAFFLGGPELFRRLKGHGSQGEVRTALLALKFSEISLFRERTGHRPLLLLDDLSSELDAGRRAFLLGFLAETDLQVLVTSTEDPPAGFGGQRRVVSNGKLYDPDPASSDHQRIQRG